MIKVRAHHLACIPRFYHGGYDETFARNMKDVVLFIRNNPETKIKILVGELDVLCKKCPHEYNNACIQTKKIGEWVVVQDNKVADYLGIKSNSICKAREIFNLSLEKINENTIKSVCKDCIFLSNCVKVGVNGAFKKNINKKKIKHN